MAQVIILSGGKGTRIADHLGGLPKSLAMLNGKTLLEYQLLLAKKNQLKKVLLLLGHKSEKIIRFCKKNDNFGLDIRFEVEQNELGTAGALLNVFELLDDSNIVMYGDTFLDVNLQNFLNEHKIHLSPITIYAHPNDHPSDSDLVVLDEKGYVQKFVSYPHNGMYGNLVNAALYVVDKVALESYKNNAHKHDIAKDFFPRYISDGNSIFAYKGIEYIKDCGTIQRLNEVEDAINSGRVDSRSLERQKKAIFIDRDGTLNKNPSGYIVHPYQMELIDGVGAALKKINKSEYLSILVTNQPVIARGDVSPEELRLIHNQMEVLLGKDGAYLDEIYYCPHHPDAGFPNEIGEYKKVCDCRKPSSGLIDRAINKFNINRLDSWMIGDSTVDIAAGLNANLKTILVETGKSGMDGKLSVYPDYSFNDLSKSIEFILSSFDRIFAYLEKLDKDLRFISIGGYSRAGKSNLASVINHFFQKKYNRVVHRISTDRWIRSGVNKGGSCVERHNIIDFEKFLEMCRVGNEFNYQLPFYNRTFNASTPNSDEIHIGPDDLLIFEGVLCNFIDKLGYRFFVDLSKGVYASRIKAGYELRGYGGENLQAVIEERIVEYDEINKTSIYDEKFSWEEWL